MMKNLFIVFTLVSAVTLVVAETNTCDATNVCNEGCDVNDICDGCVEVVNDMKLLVDNENFIKIINIICNYIVESREMCVTIIEQVAELLRHYSAEEVCTWLRLC